MPISNYSVLKGRPIAGKVVSGSSAHYQITVAAPGGNKNAYTVAVNIQSVDGSEVLYAIHSNFTPPDPAGLTALATGMTALASQPGGLALDFVRSTVNGQPMITRAAMALLPIAKSTAHFLEESATGHIPAAHQAAHALENAVVTLLNQAVADPNAVVCAFGSAFADNGVTDGIHDIHMNQGNPANNHANDNGIWSDGALFITTMGATTALFIAFQTESWSTDNNGNPA